jgi:DNA-binding MarR family transcriptional regulator
MKARGRPDGAMDRDAIDDHVDLSIRVWPALDPAVERAVLRIDKLSRYLAKTLGDTCAEVGLNLGDYKLLIKLRVAGPPHRLTPGELSQHLLVSSGAMTNRLDRLEDAGLVARSPDPHDRRGVLVELSPEGSEILDRTIEVQSAKEKALLSTLSSEDKEELNGLLRRLMTAFETSLGPLPKRLHASELE